MIEIKTFDEMIEFIKKHQLTIEQINELVSNCIGCFIVSDQYSKTEIIDKLNDFWSTHKHKPPSERPIFIDPDPLYKEDV